MVTMNMSLMIAALMLAAPQSSSSPDATEFMALMRGLHAEIEGISFLFEGQMLALHRGAVKAGRPPIGFQGHYAFRPGRLPAGLLEVYQSVAPDPPTHLSLALLGGTLDHSDRPLRSKIIDPKTNQPRRSSGGPGSLRVCPVRVAVRIIGA